MTLTRRDVAYALLALPAGFCRICHAQSQSISWDHGLCASAKEGSKDGELLKTSGDPNLDRILSAEMIAQSKFFGMQPAFMLYSGDNANAFATYDTLLPGTKGTILYNLPFLKSHLQSMAWGGAVVSGIIAHEFGHIYQFFTDYMKRLEALHTTVKFEELHADFLSGYYMGKKSASAPMDLKDYFDQFYELGDYQFASKDHHGTKAERYFAIKGGYNLSLGNRNKGIAFAAEQGELFLKEYFR